MWIGTEVGTDVSCNTKETSEKNKSGKTGSLGNEGKARAWFLTLNNYDSKEINILLAIKHKYLLWQKEVGKDGTPHIHAYLHYENPVVMPKRFIPRGHWEKVINPAACMKYCSKEKTRVGGPYEVGTKPEQGRRRDLEEMAKSYVNMPEAEFAAQNPETYIVYNRGLREYKKAVTYKDRTGAPSVEWRWGLTNSGKSFKPMEIEHKESHFVKDGTKWWNDYEQQEAIIIDDFDGRWPFRDLLRLLDRYKYQGETKGGYVKINSPFIYITCEYPPCHFWQGNELAQVTRRLAKIVRCFKLGEEYLEEENDGKKTVGYLYDKKWSDNEYPIELD